MGNGQVTYVFFQGNCNSEALCSRSTALCNTLTFGKSEGMRHYIINCVNLSL